MSLHIHAPRGHFIGQVRPKGFRHWETVTGRRNDRGTCLRLAVTKMPFRGSIRVLFVDESGYYEPSVVFEGRWT